MSVMQVSLRAEDDLLRSFDRTRARVSRASQWAWAPIPILLIATGVLSGVAPHANWRPPYLIPLLNLVFLAFISLQIAGEAVYSYQRRPSRTVLLLGGGALATGLSVLLAAIPPIIRDANAMFIVYNVGALVSASCHLAGAAWGATRARSGWREPIALYAGILLLLALLTVTAHYGELPVFFIPGHGATIWDRIVLWTTAVSFATVALWRQQLNPTANSATFTNLYAAGLGLLAVGTIAVTQQQALGDVMNWLGRGVIYLGNSYLAIAVGATLRRYGTVPPVERALRESECTLAGLLEASTEPIALTDTNGMVITANAAMAARFGLTRETLAGRSVFDFMAPDLQQQRKAQLLALLRNGQTIRFEGEREGRTLDTTVYPVLDARGRVKQLAVYAYDITARKAAENALARERAFLDAAIETLPLPLSFISTDRHTIRANDAARRWMDHIHVDKRELTQLLEPNTRQALPVDAWPVNRALRGETVASAAYDLQLIATDKTIPCLFHAAPVTLDGQIVAAVSLLEDITALREVDRAKDEFFAVLSHELLTPLASMLGYADEALYRRHDAFWEPAMQTIQRNARRQKRLIDDLLLMTRLLQRQVTLSCAPTTLEQQAAQAVAALAAEATTRGLTLTLAPSEMPLHIQSDAARLQQCLAHLLTNSLHFTPAGGTITVCCHRECDDAVLTVQDTGRGLTAEALPTIFQAFRQVDRDERAGGLGLGLALTRGLIELHGGTLTAHSPGPNQGSTFTLRLPLQKEAARHSSHERSS